MDIRITISVFPKVQHPDGVTTEGEAEIITFSDEELIDLLRTASKIPVDEQRHWQYESIEFK